MRVRGFTIDDEKTRDIDDALWVVQEPDGTWRVTVSIADVARKVPRDSDADAKAREMVATKYFATGNSPMLPRGLSEDVCSLWPGKPRRVVAIDLWFNEHLDVTRTEFTRAELVSQQKLAYGNIPGILNNAEHPLHAPVTLAAKLANGLLERRRLNGALALYDLNNGWITTEEGHLRQLKDLKETIGQVIVQEFMVAANVAVAKWAVERDVPFLFRNHVARVAAPDRAELLRQLDAAVRLPLPNIDALRERTHLLLDRAEYGADVRGHYGLNVSVYTHFTSPIRRFADLVNHRQMRAFLKREALPYTRDEVAEIAAHITKTLNDDREAQAQYMKDKAERRANRAIETRRLDGLSPKDFERVVKLEARSGNPPSEAFVEAFVRRTAEDKTPLVCLTVVLTEAPTLPEWTPVREALVAALARKPEDAVSLLAQAPQLSEGWPVTTLGCEDDGPPHAKIFTACAALKFGDDVYMGTARSKQKKRAEQWAAVSLIAAIARVPAPTFADPPTVAPTPTPAKPALALDPTRDPISVLNEWCQKTGTPAPTFAFELTGPAHLPTVTCRCAVGNHTAEATAGNKQDAKRKAAREVLAAVAG